MLSLIISSVVNAVLNNKYVRYAAIALAAIAGFFVWLHFHDAGIRKQALAEWNAKQELVYKQRADQYNMQILVLNQKAASLQDKLDATNTQLDRALGQIMDNADNAGGGSDPAPDYLKNIVNGLNKTYGTSK